MSERFGAVTVVGQRPAEDEGPVFLLSLDYSKPVYDPASGYSFFAVTAPSELVEPHGGDPARIASALSALLDEFLEGYVATNESAC